MKSTAISQGLVLSTARQLYITLSAYSHIGWEKTFPHNLSCTQNKESFTGTRCLRISKKNFATSDFVPRPMIPGSGPPDGERTNKPPNNDRRKKYIQWPHIHTHVFGFLYRIQAVWAFPSMLKAEISPAFIISGQSMFPCLFTNGPLWSTVGRTWGNLVVPFRIDHSGLRLIRICFPADSYRRRASYSWNLKAAGCRLQAVSVLYLGTFCFFCLVTLWWLQVLVWHFLTLQQNGYFRKKWKFFAQILSTISSSIPQICGVSPRGISKLCEKFKWDLHTCHCARCI